MKTYKLIPAIIILMLTITLFSCNGGRKTSQEAKEAEILPTDIVELRADQIKLANIETGNIELR